ncbi:MAG: hypothetical protein JWM33_2844 [Caulobacteraceae bacterium]|nr:hypothetical protein [Caulobacteraceae bacterium]
MIHKRDWRITVLSGRSDDAEVVYQERFVGNRDEAADRARKLMGADPRALIEPI